MDSSQIEEKRQQLENLIASGDLENARQLAEELHNTAIETGDRDLQEQIENLTTTIEESHRQVETEITQPSVQVATNNCLFIIPSWHKAIGYPTGSYLNKPVVQVDLDPVIFFATREAAVQTNSGTIYFVFGLGYYYMKFLLPGQKYISDHRELTCLVLRDFVYDKIAASPQLALHDEADIYICQEVAKVPLDLSQKSDQKQVFIKGMITRFIFAQLKDPIVEMIGAIQEEGSFSPIHWGHLLLSTQVDSFNQILVSAPVVDGIIPNYMQPTMGIRSIETGASDFLSQYFTPAELQDVANSIEQLRNVITAIQFDPMNLNELLDQMATSLPASESAPEDMSMDQKGKQSLLITGKNRLGQRTEWPKAIKMLIKAAAAATPVISEVIPEEPSFKQVVHQLHSRAAQAGDGDVSELTVTKLETTEPEKFELRKMKRKAVQQKPLPAPPTGELPEIFLYLKTIVEGNYDMPTVGHALEQARDNVRKIQFESTYVRLLSRWANKFILKDAGLSLSAREKEQVLHDLDSWITTEQEEKRKEQERIEQERLVAEQAEKSRLEQERLKQERLAREKQERLNRKRQEQERHKREEQERDRVEQDKRKQEEQERLTLEAQERVKQARLEQERITREKREQVDREKRKVEQQKLELKKLQAERKQKEKEEKNRQKKLKDLQKEQLKLERKKKQEEERIKKLKSAET